MIDSSVAFAFVWVYAVVIFSMLLHEFGHYLVFNSRGMVRGYGVWASCLAIDNTGYDAVGYLSGFFFGCLAYPLFPIFLDPYLMRFISLKFFVLIHFLSSMLDFAMVVNCSLLGREYKPRPVKRGILEWWWYVPLKKEA